MSSSLRTVRLSERHTKLHCCANAFHQAALASQTPGDGGIVRKQLGLGSMRLLVEEPRQRRQNTLQRSKAVVVAAAVCDMLYAYATPVTWWRAAPYLRVLLMVAHSADVRQQLAVFEKAAQ